MSRPGYLDPVTVEWCETCRCKTRHLPVAGTAERRCEWHAHRIVHVDRLEDAPAAVALRRPCVGTDH